MSDPATGLPARPSLEQLRKQAKELLQRARTGDAPATGRVGAVIPRYRDASELRTIVLADAQFVIAREAGFENWGALVHHVESLSDEATSSRFDNPMIRPIELRGSRPVRLADGSATTTDAIFSMFLAAREGDLARVKALAELTPGLALHEYNYTPPIHFAVREGHLELVKFFLGRGADPAYRTYPFQESLLLAYHQRRRVQSGICCLHAGRVTPSTLPPSSAMISTCATRFAEIRRSRTSKTRATSARSRRLLAGTTSP